METAVAGIAVLALILGSFGLLAWRLYQAGSVSISNLLATAGNDFREAA